MENQDWTFEEIEVDPGPRDSLKFLKEWMELTEKLRNQEIAGTEWRKYGLS